MARTSTLGECGTRCPSLRGQVQGAWDLAFAWQAEEPYNHHTAMPAFVLLALLSVCLLWGWVYEAGIFALAWGGLRRISEATMARRQQDLVDVIVFAFSKLPKSSRLWHGSNQTLRRRLDVALSRLKVASSRCPARSFRPGGATFILQLTEDSELVRRRGRVASAKVMEVYLQEITASTFMTELTQECRELVVAAAGTFPDILLQAKQREFFLLHVPTGAWYMRWS